MENGTKKPSAKPGTKGRWPKGKANRVPRVKVLQKIILSFYLFVIVFTFLKQHTSSRRMLLESKYEFMN
jgi:hypothetical protein